MWPTAYVLVRESGLAQLRGHWLAPKLCSGNGHGHVMMCKQRRATVTETGKQRRALSIVLCGDDLRSRRCSTRSAARTGNA